MQNVGTVKALFFTSKESKETIRQTTLHIDPKGILGDKHYGGMPERSILISSLESYAITEKFGIQMPYGYLGENILMDYNPYHLPVGTHLHIGECTFEITQNCTLCNHLAAIDKRIPDLLKHDRGIFAKALTLGILREGDAITLD